MNNQPLISIIIPVYNGSNYIKEAIDSALSQTYSNIEVLVINDGSTDGGATEEIVLSYGDKIRYFKKPNGGVSSALNLGISQMRGEYFSWLSHDDAYTKDKVAVQIQQILESGAANVISLCGSCFIDSASNIIQHKRVSDPFTDGQVSWNDALAYLLDKGWFNGCSLLIPRAAFGDTLRFHEGLRFSQDHLMWIEILLSQYDLVYSNYVGVLSRVHNAQQTHISKHLFKHDSAVIAEIVAPKLTVLGHKLLYLFTKRNAILGCDEAVSICCKEASRSHIFSVKDLFLINIFSWYGSIRPIIRKFYYSLFLRVKTH